MLIVIEGADCTGKTTLARRLASDTGARIIHRGAPTRPLPDEYTTDLEDAAVDGPGLVLDRWHIGELVYGPLYRGGTDMTPAIFEQIEDRLLELGAVLIHATDTVRNVLHRMQQRGETFLQPQHVPFVLNKFAQCVKASRLPRLTHIIGLPVSTDAVLTFASAHA